MAKRKGYQLKKGGIAVAIQKVRYYLKIL